MSAQPITTILFDVGSVIIAPLDPQANRLARKRLAGALGFASGDEMWNSFFESDEWTAAKTGQMVSTQMWETLLTPYGLASLAEREAFLAQLYATEGVLPGMRALIEWLHGRYRLGILSNWDDRLEDILEQELDIARYFDTILNSHRIGVAKPDPLAFQLALERLQAKPGEVLFIDDLSRNTRAAAELGLHTHVYRGLQGLLHDLQQRGIIPSAEEFETGLQDG